MKYDFEINTLESNSSHVKLLKRIQPGAKVLELGCASGYLSKILKQQLDCKVFGIEIDKDSAEKARAYCDQVLVADLDIDDVSLALSGKKFDVILCADVLEHLKNPARVLQNLQTYLADSGRLLASVPNVAHSSIRLELFQGHFDYENLGLLDETHLHFYTLDGLVNTLMDAGFVCYDVDYTVHDLADETVDNCLSFMGIKATDEILKHFHTPEAIAYQYIIEACPSHPSLLKHRVPALFPKPMASSIEYYGLKEEKIGRISQELNQNKEHVKNLEKIIDDLTIHNNSRQQEINRLNESIQHLNNQIQALQTHNDNRQQHIDELAKMFNALNAESFEMEEALFKGALIDEKYQALVHEFELIKHQRDEFSAVLDRIHGKLLFRLIRKLRRLKLYVRQIFIRDSGSQNKSRDFNDYQGWVSEFDNLTGEAKNTIQKEILSVSDWPKISLLMPVYNTRKKQLIQAIESVTNQLYPNWELCIADDNSDSADIKKVLQNFAKNDERIKIVFREVNGHISEASNSALDLVDSEYIALLDHDDVLSEDALFRIAQIIRNKPDVKLIYSDEDKLDSEGKRFAPYFKPDWNPDLFMSHNYICHLGVYRTEIIRKLGGFRKEFDGAQDYDLALRYVENITAGEIVHIPRILYHWRADVGSTANGVHEKPYAKQAIKAVVQDALARRGVSAKVHEHKRLPGSLSVHYDLPDNPPLVSLIIPTRNGFNLLYRCIESILKLTDYPNYEIIVIDNGSDEITTRRYLNKLVRDQKITRINNDCPFNYALLNNQAVQQANGSVIGLLNNDLEVIHGDWLSEMVSQSLRNEVGAVGAKLLYPDNTVQHGGVVIGLGGVAGHSHKHFPKQHPGYCGRLMLTQNFTAVTAACLVVRKSVFQEVGGFDEVNLTVAFNDVDLCLRIKEQGYWNVWTPNAELIHHESATRGYEDTPEKQLRFQKEIEFMKKRWGDELLNDPAYNPNLTLDREDFSLAWPPR